MKIGLVLSGGGAKGAYQTGFFQALVQLELLDSVTAVSGCSIGALGALMLCGSDRKSWDQVWHTMSYDKLLRAEAAAAAATHPGGAGLAHRAGELMGWLRQMEKEILNLPQLLRQGELSPLSQDGMAAMIRQYVDFDRVRRGPRALWVCAYNLNLQLPQYFQLNSLSDEDITTLALASSAIPIMFPAVEYQGQHYCDGGVLPPYSKLSNGDKVPVTPLRDAGCDLVIVVYLSHYDKVTLEGFPPSTRLLELYPSSPLEMIRGAGTMNLSKETLAENTLMGYHDGLAALAPLLLEQARGGSGQEALLAHRHYNQQLLEGKLPLLRRAEEAAGKH